jgi:hypothetical protein
MSTHVVKMQVANTTHFLSSHLGPRFSLHRTGYLYKQYTIKGTKEKKKATLFLLMFSTVLCLQQIKTKRQLCMDMLCSMFCTEYARAKTECLSAEKKKRGEKEKAVETEGRVDEFVTIGKHVGQVLAEAKTAKREENPILCSKHPGQTPSMQLLLQVNNRRIPSTAVPAHIVIAPRALDHGRDGARDAQQLILHHCIGLGHALVELGRHVVIELAAAALDKHLGDRCHAGLCHRRRRPHRHARLQLHVLGKR